MSMPVRGLAMVVVLSALAGCVPPGVRTEVVRPVEDVGIGLLAPLSGPDAAIGAEQRRGAELAAELVNDEHRDVSLPLAPGTGLPALNGARLRLSVTDTGGTADTVAAHVERLVTDLHPVALVGGDREPVTAAASQRAERLRVPYVDAGSSATYLTETGLDWYFRTAPSDRIVGAAVFALLTRPGRERVPARRIVLVQPGDGRHADLATTIRELAGEAGIAVTVVKAESTTSAAAKVAQGDEDVAVLLAPTREDASELVAEVRRRDATLPLVGLGPGFTDPQFDAADADGLLRPAPWSGEFTSRNRPARAVDELFQRRFGTPMSAPAAATFTAVLALATAIDGAAATRPDGVRTALLAADIPGTRLIVPWLGIQFGDGGQNARAGAVVEQVIDGELRLVHPAELATAPLDWPYRAPATAR